MKLDGQKVKQIRNKKLLTQEQLAIMSGLNIRTIQRMEKSGNASKETIKAVCAALELKPNSLEHSSPSLPFRTLSVLLIPLLTLWTGLIFKEKAVQSNSFTIESNSIEFDSNGNYLMQGDIKASFPKGNLRGIASSSMFVQGGQIVTGQYTNLLINDRTYNSTETIVVSQDDMFNLYTDSFSPQKAFE